MFCEILFLKDRVDWIGKNHVPISYFGYRSTPSHMHSGHLEKSAPNFREDYISLPQNCLPAGSAPRFSEAMWLPLGLTCKFCLITRTNSGTGASRENLNTYVDNIRPVLLFNLFPFCQFFLNIKSCLILLSFNDFVTTGLWGFFPSFIFFQTKKYSKV